MDSKKRTENVELTQRFNCRDEVAELPFRRSQEENDLGTNPWGMSKRNVSSAIVAK
jgi:hypothetical protein